MPYEHSIENKDDHIRVEISGDLILGKEADEVIKVLFDVIDQSYDAGICKILLVSKLSGHFPVLACIKVIESFERQSFIRKFKLANVALDEGSLHDIEFTETIAVNRGYRYRVFENEEDAKTWLLES